MPIKIYGGGIVEINAAPGFRMHMHPTHGRPRPVGEAVVSMLFPKGVQARIPLIAITGTNGKSTTGRMVAHIIRQDGKSVGLTSTSGVYLNDSLLWEGDSSGPQSARQLLQNSEIDYAVLETARGGLLREGLAFDVCDVGAVLNVTEDHLGLKGINTLEDLAAVKSIVAESVHRKGVSVLNADDKMTFDMAKDAGGSICFFSMRGGHLMDKKLRDHVNKGGLAVVLENWSGHQEIVIHTDGQRLPLMDVKQIPATHGGIIDFNIQNALAAASIAFGLGFDIKIIRAGLSSFVSTFEENPGRMNMFDGHGFRVILDYAHNPAGLSALLKAVDHMQEEYGNIIGMVSTPGDRRDEDIREMGRIAAGSFDTLVFRESPDERGRPAGEVMRLLREGALAAGFSEEKIICIRREEEATAFCLENALPGDLIVVLPTDVKKIWNQIKSFKPSQDSLLTNRRAKLQVFHA